MTGWRKILNIISPGNKKNSCHGDSAELENNGLGRVGIVGNPNVGKSVIFNRLTGSNVIVSNYPGTTVDVSSGKARIEDREYEIVDTPGMYSLLPITEEERVARLLLFENKTEVVLHVVDAKNLERMLPLTLQLIEAELPVILNLNMMDETRAAGIEIDISTLEEELGIPVVTTVATTGRGMEGLRKKLAEYVSSRNQTA